MPLFRHKHKKIKYEAVPSEKKEENGVVISEGFSLDAVNLFINNFVDPGDEDDSGARKLNFREGKGKSWDALTARARQDVIENLKFKQNLSDVDARKHATFMRLKRKLENIRNFYPDVYYSKESVIDMWAKQSELNKINLDLLEYDRDSPAWLWI